MAGKVISDKVDKCLHTQEPVSLGKQVPSCFAETSLELQMLRSQYKSVRAVLILLWNTLDPKCAGKLWSTNKRQTKCPAMRQHLWQSSPTHLKVGCPETEVLNFHNHFWNAMDKKKKKRTYHDFVNLHIIQSICADRYLGINKKLL